MIEDGTELRIDSRPDRSKAGIVFGVVAALFLAALTFAAGRSTGPIHRHALPAESEQRLSVEASCRPVTEHDRSTYQAADGPYSLDVEMAWRSGWREDDQTAFMMAMGPGSGLWYLDEKAARAPVNQGGSSWYGFGSVPRHVAGVAERWAAEHAADGWTLAPFLGQPVRPGTPGDVFLTGYLYGRRGGGGTWVLWSEEDAKPQRIWMDVLFVDADASSKGRTVFADCA